MDFNNLEYDKIFYNRPSTNQLNKRYISDAKYQVDGQLPEDIEILTPHLLCKTPIKVNDRKCNLTMKLNKTNKDFFKFLTGLEEHSKSVILDNTMEWFGKHIPIDVIDDYHNQYVKISRDDNPSIKVQVPFDRETGEVTIPIVSDKGVVLKQNTVYEGTIVKAQMRYIGIKFYKQHFTSEWYLTKLVVYDNYELDDTDEDYDFTTNEDMLSIYSEKTNDIPTIINTDIKINKVLDDNTIIKHKDTVGTTSNNLEDINDIKVNMIEDESVQDESVQDESVQDESVQDESVQDETTKDETTKDETTKDKSVQDEIVNDETTKDKTTKDENTVEEVKEEDDVEVESVLDSVSVSRSIRSRKKRRRIKLPNGKYKVLG